MAKGEFPAKETIVEEAIPAAIRVKDEILIYRSSTIQALADVMYRRRKGIRTKEQINVFQANIVALYQVLRECLKGKQNMKMKKELDDAIKNGTKIKFAKLYDYFCKLEHRIYTLKITKIVIKKIDDEKAF